jgi:hypothetical protein
MMQPGSCPKRGHAQCKNHRFDHQPKNAEILAAEARYDFAHQQRIHYSALDSQALQQ